MPENILIADGGKAAAGLPGEAGQPPAALPCHFVTTASEEKKEEEKPPLPGPRKKQADALTENIKWLAQTFGQERIGFLTLTLGDVDAGGRYRNLRDRKKAQRRFHSLLTNVLAPRYQCGVTITERHVNLGIHFHLAVVCAADIRGQIDFAACFPPKGFQGKPLYKADYSTANNAIKREWAFWRHMAKFYGFGRHQLQPMRANGAALGRYLGAYLRKDWEHRLPQDKGARCVRYFGHWSNQVRTAGQRRKAPPNGCRFGWLTPNARAWRELVKQVISVLQSHGAQIGEHNIKDICGPKWAWKLGKLFEAVRFEVGDWQPEAVRAAIAEHNLKVQVRWLSAGGDPARACWWHVTEITLDHLCPSPARIKLGVALLMAKVCEAENRQRLKIETAKLQAQAEQESIFAEVADSFRAVVNGGQL